ncbi:DUF3159 domain-containing protein [Arthrobacter cryoconiti]|uniref:DUF3159 domain-containing protein n=1 Tax=Arthrobacter cryoconiti TaxID=748907 RepID=A0ABV8R3N4_9MICC|nr:DUF3159 domain-containing protein [Arthrobacter cryoconiti]MCC9069046.1 DUF3159 domain-containing protein [Arthrobacter cryoconiti]
MNENTSDPLESDPKAQPNSFANLANGLASASPLVRKENGHIDLLAAAGGIRGIVESVLPGLVFLVTFTLTRELMVSLIGSVVIAALFVIVRLFQRTSLTQSLAGIAGVALSAILALKTGKAEDFYTIGFYTNAIYLAAMVLSIAFRWPVLGVVFGYARNEGLRWRKKPERLRAYRVATWIMVGVMAFRLAVQLPLYFTAQIDALGAMRLLMGLPLYVLGLWIAWLISRPVSEDDIADGGAAGDTLAADATAIVAERPEPEPMS